MGFESWESFNDDRIALPFNGKVYVLPQMPAKVAMWFRAMQANAKAKTPLSKMTDVEQARAILGGAYDEMVADDVPDLMVARAVQVAIADWRLGRVTAEIVWRDGVADPKAVAEKLIQAIAATPSPSTGEDDATQKPASSSTTTSRRKPRARRSNGATSSDAGS